MKNYLLFSALSFLMISLSNQYAHAAIPITQPIKVEKKKIEKEKTTKAKPFQKSKNFLQSLVEKKKAVGALLALFLGAFGAHRFYYNDYNMGYIMLGISAFAVTLLAGGLVLANSIATPFLGLIIAGIGSYILYAMIWWGIIDFIRIVANKYPKK